MSNNPFNIAAEEAGREFAQANPDATGIQVDAAALAHSPFDPANRHFQQAATAELARQRQQIWYRWVVRCRSGHNSFGTRNTVKEAQESIRDAIDLYKDQFRDVVHYAIYDRENVCLVSMDRF